MSHKALGFCLIVAFLLAMGLTKCVLDVFEAFNSEGLCCKARCSIVGMLPVYRVRGNVMTS